DLSGVHHLTAKDKEIFMLVEKDYPLKKGLELVMISYKLQVENYSQMAEDLIRKIYNIANTPRNIKFRGGLLGIKCTRHSHCQVKSSHWQYKFLLPVKIIATAKRIEMPLPVVCTTIEEKKKKLPVKDRWQLHLDSAPCLAHDSSSNIVFDNSNADIESFSPSPIPNLDNDSNMEEINLYFNLDDPMPSGIEEDDDDSERDVPILEELLDSYSLSPPTKPPDGNTGTLNINMMGDVSDQQVPIPNLTITRVLNQEKSPDLLSHLGFEAF
nr:hypothetical protein [Tanacetum cinerariifolium]